MNKQLIPVSGNQKSRFSASGAAPAAAMWKNKVMLEPYDVYQLALHFQSEGRNPQARGYLCAVCTPHAAGTIFPDFFC